MTVNEKRGIVMAVELLVLSVFIFVAVLIRCVLDKFGKEIDHKEHRLQQISGEEQKVVYQELESSFYQRFFAPKIRKLSDLIASFFPGIKGKSKGNAQLEKQFRLAGIRMSVPEFNTIRTLVMIGCIVFGILLSFTTNEFLYKILFIVLGVAAALMLPKYFVLSKITSRQKQIKLQLPEVIDLLCVSIEAGLSFDAGILKISEKMSGPFVDELMIMYREMQMGRPRKDALKALSDNCDIPELKMFTSAIIQADQMGIPIKNVLQVQAKQLRDARKQIAQEKGMKAPVKMLIPMVLFIFPVLFIVLMAPTVLNIIKTFS